MTEQDWGTAPAQQDSGWGSPPPNADQQQAVPPAGIEPPSLDDALSGTGVKSFSFDAPIGTTADGLIVEIPKARQKTDFDTKLPMFWKANKLTTETVGDDGKALTPAWTYPIHVQTALREEEDDDGVRSIFFEYRKLEALKAAQQAAGQSIAVGGRLMVRYMSGGPKDRSPNATKFKVFAVKYFPPGSPEAAQAAATRPAPAPPVAPAQAAPQQASWGTQDDPPF